MNFALAVIAIAVYVLFTISLFRGISNGTLTKESYLYAVGYLFMGMSCIVISNACVLLAYPYTYVLNENLINTVSLAFGSLFLAICLLQLFLILRKRHQMRKAWLATNDKPVISITSALHESTAIPLEDLPLTIKIRANWNSVWKVLLGVTGGICLIVIMGFIVDSQKNWNEFLAVLITLFSNMLIISGIIVLIVNNGNETLQLTAEGLRKRKTQFVRWQDVRFFALLKNNQIEVSTAKKIVRFSRLTKDNTMHLPMVPFEDYDRQMDVVLLLIAERTQLPLFDCRDREPF